VSSVVLSDQVENLDLRARKATPKGRASAGELIEVPAKITSLLGIRLIYILDVSCDNLHLLDVECVKCRRKARAMTDKALIASVAQIESKIFLIRGQKVMLDADLAVLYEVETKVLNQAVKRNIERFPEDFMFQLNAEEVASLRRSSDTSGLRSQFVT
jgi:hypothetical protein